MTVPLRVMLNYYGSKWKLAKHYEPPRYGTVVEPFAGGAAYSLHHHDRRVVLCDLDEKLIAVCRYLIRASATEIRSLPLLEPSQRCADLPVIQEAKWLIGWNVGMGHSLNQQLSKWALSGDRQVSYWGAERRERIAAQVGHIRHWRAYHCHYSDAPVNGPATWFIDPPYQGAGKHYKMSSTSIDFGALGDWCRSRPGQVMVCENEGASWLPFRHFRGMVGMQGKRSIEVVWSRDDAFQLPLFQAQDRAWVEV